jgi:TonB family protein
MKSLLLFISFVFLFHLGYSQNDTIIYYKANNKPALSKEDAIRYIEVKKKKENEFKVDTYFKSDDVWKQSKEKQEIFIENDSLLKIKVKEGISKKTIYRKYKKLNNCYSIKNCNRRGKILAEGLSRTLLIPHWEGQIKTYYESGKPKSVCRYRNNQLVANEVWMNKGKFHLKNVFETVDVMPEFIGGEQALEMYIARAVRYPRIAQENGITGRVIVTFVVDERGNVIGEHIHKGVDRYLDNEALRVVRSIPKWTVGVLDGKAVKVSFNVPINFMLR